MYIRAVQKKNKGLEKTYHYYRLVHGYKIGTKVRQQTLLNLGTLEQCPVEKHKTLADPGKSPLKKGMFFSLNNI